MQNTPAITQDYGADPASIEERDRALATMFRTNDLVWMVNERYDEVASAWFVDFVRQGMLGRWVRLRYSYDTTNGVIYFMGERPVTDEELSALRRTGKVFPVSRLLHP